MVQGDEQSSTASKVAVNTAGPYIAHTDLQTTEAQARTLPHSKGSRPTGMEAPGSSIGDVEFKDP